MKFRQCLESSIDTGRYFFSLPEHEVIKLKASMVHVLVESYVVIVKKFKRCIRNDNQKNNCFLNLFIFHSVQIHLSVFCKLPIAPFLLRTTSSPLKRNGIDLFTFSTRKDSSSFQFIVGEKYGLSNPSLKTRL